MECNYVCAGFETLSTLTDKFITGKNFDNHFTREQVSNFFADTCNKFLHSFGQAFTGRSRYDNYVDKEVELLRNCRKTGFFDRSYFFVDSGGFQVSIGKLDRKEFDLLFKLYYDFLRNHSDVFDRAFILDLVPGPGCKLFRTFDEVEKMNNMTYLSALQLPEEVRRKIIFIYHFRTPKLWDIFTKILLENDMFSYFQYFATGGIVANQSSDTSIPCIIYTIPLVPLLRQAKEHNFKVFNFHVLGGATFRDILFYEIFRKHVLKEHDIELNITFDSSSVFKMLMHARTCSFLDGKIVRKLDLRSSNLDKFVGELTTLEVFRKEIHRMSKKYGFKVIALEKLYSEETETFPEEVRIYSMFYVLEFYSRLQEMLREEANNLYQVFCSGEFDVFNSKLLEVTCLLNEGKRTKKQTEKVNSVVRSLKMLSELDVDFCKYLVDKFLAKDEFTSLDSSNYRLDTEEKW